MMLRGSLYQRFISDNDVKEFLTGIPKVSLPSALTPELCALLQLAPQRKIVQLSRVITKGVGATQCRPYIMHLEGGEKFFLKLTPLANHSASKQRAADQEIRQILDQDSDFLFVPLIYSAIINQEFTHNELLFFPYVSGENLFMTNSRSSLTPVAQEAHFKEIGQSLAKMHIHSMKKTNNYQEFLNSGIVSGVLVHDDWQATNIMIDIQGKAIFVDSEGTTFSYDSYRNLAESWSLTGKNIVFMESLLTGYVHSFPSEIQDKLKNNIREILQSHYQIELTENKINNSHLGSLHF